MTDQSFPTLFSTPDPEALATRILPQYLLKPPIQCRLYSARRNSHYRVRDASGVYHLKVYAFSPSWGDRLAEQVQREVALMNHLHEQGVPVCVPVPKKNGDYLSVIHAPEGIRYAVLLHVIPGQPLGDRGVSLEQIRRVGALTARMHAGMDALPDGFTPVHWNLRWIVDVGLEHLAPILSRRQADLAYLEEVGSAVKERIRPLLPQQKPAYGVIHGDLHPGHIYASQQDLYVVDWESTGNGWRAWEAAYYLTGDFGIEGGWRWDPDVEAQRERRREVFLESYCAERALSEDELATIHVFSVARYLLAIGRQASVRARFEGAAAVQDEQLSTCMAFLRRWMEHYHPL